MIQMMNCWAGWGIFDLFVINVPSLINGGIVARGLDDLAVDASFLWQCDKSA